MFFNPDAVRRIRQTVKEHEAAPAGRPNELQPRGFPAPRAFLVGRADEAIDPTTDPLTSGDINSGTISIYRWNTTTEAWEDTEDNVEAYDFSGIGCAATDWVQLHRLAHGEGVLWIIGTRSTGNFCYRTATTYGTTMAATLLNRGQIYSVDSSNYYWDDSGGGIKVTVPGWYRAYGRARFNLEATTGNHEFVNATGGLKLQIDGTDVPRSNRQCSLHQEQLYYMYGFTDTHTQRTVFDVGIAANVLVQGDDMVYTPLSKTVTIDDLIRELVIDMPVELEAGEEVTLWSTSSISGTYTSATMRIGAAALMGQYFGHEAHLALEKL